MQKNKLKSMRDSRGFTQKEMAKAVPMDVSNYCRKENGETRINKEEWEKFSKLLNCSIDEIYEAEDYKTSIHYENTTFAENTVNYNNSNHNYYCQIPKIFIEHINEYINFLRTENIQLKQELQKNK